MGEEKGREGRNEQEVRERRGDGGREGEGREE